MDLVGSLGLDRGLTAVVGAGGKKTTIYTAANLIDRAVVTATVRIPRFDEHVSAVVQTADPVTALEDIEEWPIGLVADWEESRYIGYERPVVDDLAARGDADAILVKADGARNREFKAPGEDEPRIPDAADRVLALVSTHVVGKPLTEEYVHRPERVMDLTGLTMGEPIEAEDVATVMVSAEGGRKHVPSDAELIPVLNKVDDAEDESVAREVATAILERSRIDRVALTHLVGDGDLLVDIVS